MKSNSGKLFLSLGVILASAAYALWQFFNNQPATPAAIAIPTTQTVPTPVPVTPTPLISPPVATPTPTPTKPTGQYVDGTYTGTATNAYYGTVQVEAIISGGKLADVKFLQYPNDRGTSLRLSNQAMPVLTQEALKAQSAQVNGVSGASQTSEAFVQSLASALAQAKSSQ